MFKYRPDAVLAMGGFTSLAPTLAALLLRRPIFYHESNTIPGKAVRWLAKVASLGFCWLRICQSSVEPREVVLTGTPVRREFESWNGLSAVPEWGWILKNHLADHRWQSESPWVESENDAGTAVAPSILAPMPGHPLVRHAGGSFEPTQRLLTSRHQGSGPSVHGADGIGLGLRLWRSLAQVLPSFLEMAAAGCPSC